MEELIQRAVADLKRARRVAVLTGAGVSVESGIPPFRGPGGVWEKIDPMEYATIEAFMADPAKVWEVLLREMKRVIDAALPNDSHRALVRLEEMGLLRTVITQNVDGLHQKAGSRDVVEFHGSFARHRCLACGERKTTAEICLDRMPPRCFCGGIFRPECVFFGEDIPAEMLWRSRQSARECDVMLVLGTSASVHPAAYVPVFAKEAGATVIEINAEPTPLTGRISDYTILGAAGEIMNRILAQLDA